MEITLNKVKVADLVEGFYQDESTAQVKAWGGALDVRPKYQRNFVYGERERDAVINTVLRGFPLNIMYWVRRKNRAEGEPAYEVLDGQQRIISICQFATNQFSVRVPAAGGGYNDVNEPNLLDDMREAFYGYELDVYICEGSEAEKMDWFQTINIAGKDLSVQEIRNAVYHSAWLTDVKSLLSRNGNAAYRKYAKWLGKKYNRQEYVERVLSWLAGSEGLSGADPVASYMLAHNHDASADPVWDYLERVMAWAQTVFPDYYKEMQGLGWGFYYNGFSAMTSDRSAEVAELMADREVTNKKGVFAYVLTGDERHLSLRRFEDADKRARYEEQKGVCPKCGGRFALEDMEGDHIVPWCRGGRTEYANLQMLCRRCNGAKSGS